MPPTLLITYKGLGYSIPSKYMNKRVKLYPIDHKLYVYFNTELITVHELTNNKFNYKNDHYLEALKYSIKNDDLDIEQIARENLELLERIRNIKSTERRTFTFRQAQSTKHHHLGQPITDWHQEI